MRSFRDKVSIPDIAQSARDRVTAEPMQENIPSPSLGFVRAELRSIDFTGDEVALILAVEPSALGDERPTVTALSINNIALEGLKVDVGSGSSPTGATELLFHIFGWVEGLSQLAMKLKGSPLVIKGRFNQWREFGAYRTSAVAGVGVR